MFFVLGLLLGIFAFGETVDSWLSGFWNSSFMGRFTLPELFGLPAGVLVAGIVIMAVFLFWVVEKVEAWMTGIPPKTEQRPYKMAGAAALIAVAVAVMLIGQPTSAAKWQQMAAEKQPLLDSRAVYIHPAEVLSYIYNDRVQTVLLDVRPESDYNLFHLNDAQLVAPENLPALAYDLRQKPANTLFVVMGNNEAAATAAWKTLVAESVPNVYILEGGVNKWLDTFNVQPAGSPPTAVAMVTPAFGDDSLRYTFPAALGAQYPAAYPEPTEFKDIVFESKVKLKMKQASGGG